MAESGRYPTCKSILAGGPPPKGLPADVKAKLESELANPLRLRRAGAFKRTRIRGVGSTGRNSRNPGRRSRAWRTVIEVGKITPN